MGLWHVLQGGLLRKQGTPPGNASRRLRGMPGMAVHRPRGLPHGPAKEPDFCGRRQADAAYHFCKPHQWRGFYAFFPRKYTKKMRIPARNLPRVCKVKRFLPDLLHVNTANHLYLLASGRRWREKYMEGIGARGMKATPPATTVRKGMAHLPHPFQELLAKTHTPYTPPARSV